MQGQTAEKIAGERPMRRLGDEMYGGKDPTPKQREAIEQVRKMANELATLPVQRRSFYLSEIRTHTSGRQRWLATRHTPPGHEAFGPLMAMLDALIADQDTIQTKHGCFTEEDIRLAEAAIVREDGKSMVLFPIRYPWKRKPDPDKGDAGERLDAIYRTPGERGPKKESFRVVPRPERNEADWWDE